LLSEIAFPSKVFLQKFLKEGKISESKKKNKEQISGIPGTLGRRKKLDAPAQPLSVYSPDTSHADAAGVPM
jgi:hypothetical protein